MMVPSRLGEEETAYLDVYVWKAAVEKAKSFDVDKVRVAAVGLDAPRCFLVVPGAATISLPCQ